VTKKYLAKQVQAAKKKDMTSRLVQSYLAKQDMFSSSTFGGVDRSVDDYYINLLGIRAPPSTTVMGQKGSLINKAYAVAMKQQEIHANEFSVAGRIVSDRREIVARSSDDGTSSI
jgi:hypothetical protein